MLCFFLMFLFSCAIQLIINTIINVLVFCFRVFNLYKMWKEGVLKMNELLAAFYSLCTKKYICICYKPGLVWIILFSFQMMAFNLFLFLLVFNIFGEFLRFCKWCYRVGSSTLNSVAFLCFIISSRVSQYFFPWCSTACIFVWLCRRCNFVICDPILAIIFLCNVIGQ